MLQFRPLTQEDRFEYPGAQPDAEIAVIPHLHFDFTVLIGDADDTASVFIYNRPTGEWEGEYVGTKDQARLLTDKITPSMFNGWKYNCYFTLRDGE